MKKIMKIMAAALALVICLSAPASALGRDDDDDWMSIEEIISGRIDLTDQFEEEEEPEEEPEDDGEIRIDMSSLPQIIDLTDQPGSLYGKDDAELENIIRMLIGYAVPITNTLTTIHECMTGNFTTEQKSVKVAVALTADVLSKGLQGRMAVRLNNEAQAYINNLIRTGQFKGGSDSRSVEYVLGAIESVVGSLSTDTANMIRDLYGRAKLLF